MRNDNFIKLIELIEYKHIDIAKEYLDYVRMALAIADEYGEEGREYFLRLCRQSDNFDERDAQYRYSNALRTGRGQVHIGTVFTLAENAGVKLPKGCYIPADKGGNHASAKVTAKKKDDKVIGGSPRQAPEEPEGKKDRRQTATVEDIESYLDRYELRHNVITDKIVCRAAGEKTWARLNDRTENSMWAQFCKTGFKCNIMEMHNVINSDYVQSYNPFECYFDSLPKWTHDQPDHIEQLADRITLVDENPDSRAYLRKCIKKWIVAMVAGVLNDGFVNQYILTLLGKQGIYKSSFFNQLLPPELQEYFHAQTFKGKVDRDENFALAQNMLISIEELDNISQNEMNRLKAQTSTTHFDERKVYGRNTEHLARHNSYAATGNNIRILNDLTGSRRWLVFNVENIVSPFDHPFNHEGIYSEAYALMKEGKENYIFTSDDNAEITERNHDFEAVCMEEELIDKFFDKPAENETGIAMTATEIIAKINIYVKHNLSPQKVGMVMKKKGFVQKKINGVKKFRVHERTADEMKLIETQDARLFDGDANVPEQQDLPF